MSEGSGTHAKECPQSSRGKNLHSLNASSSNLKENSMAKGEQKGNRESKKPKKEKIKTIAAAPSQKAAGWQPSFGPGKKK